MKTTILTRQFEFAHGKLPRGNGGWCFCPSLNFGTANYLDCVACFSGPFGAAKKQAAAHFKALGVSLVVVCP